MCIVLWVLLLIILVVNVGHTRAHVHTHTYVSSLNCVDFVDACFSPQHDGRQRGATLACSLSLTCTALHPLQGHGSSPSRSIFRGGWGRTLKSISCRISGCSPQSCFSVFVFSAAAAAAAAMRLETQGDGADGAGNKSRFSLLKTTNGGASPPPRTTTTGSLASRRQTLFPPPPPALR